MIREEWLLELPGGRAAARRGGTRPGDSRRRRNAPEHVYPERDHCVAWRV